MVNIGAVAFSDFCFTNFRNFIDSLYVCNRNQDSVCRLKLVPQFIFGWVDYHGCRLRELKVRKHQKAEDMSAIYVPDVDIIDFALVVKEYTVDDIFRFRHFTSGVKNLRRAILIWLGENHSICRFISDGRSGKPTCRIH